MKNQLFLYRYSPLQINATGLDAIGRVPGHLTYLQRGVLIDQYCTMSKSLFHFFKMLQDCDLVTSAVATTQRLTFVDFTNPTLYLPVTYLIPKSHQSDTNVWAVMKSFHSSVC